LPSCDISLQAEYKKTRQLAFEAKFDLDKGTTRCNCSLCTKTRFWFALVQAEDFKVEKGDPLLGNLQTLVNVPKSKEDGFETQAWKHHKAPAANGCVKQSRRHTSGSESDNGGAQATLEETA
jgi:hypothetical protein